MSYRNPQQNIDTQSGQAFANLQRTVAGTFGGIVQQELATQKELARREAELVEKRKKDLEKYNIEEADIVLGLKEATIKNNTLNASLGESFGPLVDKYSDIMISLDSGLITDPKEIARLRSEAADIRTLSPRVGKLLEGLGIVFQNIEATQGRMGLMGGVDPGTPGTMLEDMKVFAGEKSGKRETKIDYKDGKFIPSIIITQENGEPKTYTEDQINNYTNGKSQGIRIIPDERENMKSLSDSYVNMKDKEAIYGNPTTRRFENKGTGETVVETYRPLKRDLLKANAIVVIQSNIDAMDINGRVAFMNNIVSPDNRIYDSENIDSIENKKKLEEGYTDYWLKKYTSGDQVLKTEVIKPDKPGKNKIPTKAQLDRAKNAEATAGNFAQVIDDGKDLEDSLKKANITTSRVITDTGDEKGKVLGYIAKKGDKEYRFMTGDSEREKVKKLLEFDGKLSAIEITENLDKLFPLGSKEDLLNPNI